MSIPVKLSRGVFIALIALTIFGVTTVMAAGLLNLPTTPISIFYGPWKTFGPISVLDMTLSNVPSGFDVTNGTYAGWCFEEMASPGYPITEPVSLYDSTNPASMPADYQSVQWNKVNYVLNHKGSYTTQSIQAVLWILSGFYDGGLEDDAGAPALLAEADANGANFVPGPGQVVAVLLDGLKYPDVNYQEVIIEVPIPQTPPPPPPPPPGGEGCTPGYWKNHQESWAITGYSPSDKFDVVFGTSYFKPGYTLWSAIGAKGGGLNVLARHGTAALLSASASSVNYPYTVDEVKAMVQSGNIDPLVAANELGCPLK